MAQENTARVITIAATEQPQDIRLRVAAYARVSSSSDEQLNSFAAQNRYYTELISSKDNWQLVDIYADEGITGTSIEKRDDFKRIDNNEYETTRLQRMVSKCRTLTELDVDLLAKVVDRVIVNKLSTQVILKNGQTIGSEEVI